LHIHLKRLLKVAEFTDWDVAVRDSIKSKTSEITYFEKPGRVNTEAAISCARKRALELGLKTLVVASTTGRTGVMAAEALADTDIEVVVVAEHFGFSEEGKWLMDAANLDRLRSLNVKVMTQSHVLSGVERSISRVLGGTSRVEAIAEAFRRIVGVGVKVCIEATIMAADSGYIPCGPDIEVVVIAGTGGGADTALVVRPAHMNNFFDLEIREVICMPRYKKPAKGNTTQPESGPM